ncbi:MAG: SLC13 family permease [Ekhidna sp.]
MNRKKIGLFTGPFLFVIVFFFEPFAELPADANAVLATTLWVATWWLSEALPIAANALLPIVLLPLTGGAPITQTTAAYGDKMLYLFLGGFIIAIAIQKWNLHKRIALFIISKVGTNAQGIVLGFILATGLLSMWISNTATTLMMITIATALIAQIRDLSDRSDTSSFFKALLLGIAFSASIGGVATLVGTPTNPIFVAVVQTLYGSEFSFASWMAFALPFSLMMLIVCWLVLTRLALPVHKVYLPIGKEMIRDELNKLGKMGYEEKIISGVFILTAIMWITRSFILNLWIPGINDTVIAIAAATLMFIIPTKQKDRTLLTWEEAERLPWGVIILFGGGLSLAAAFQSSGLAEWLGLKLTLVGDMQLLLIILIIALAVNFLTEVTSNVATASIMLPVLASLADAIDVHPYILMVPATMAASCAFMLPIATGPNAIAFSSGELKMNDMVRSGIWLNVTSSLLISLLVYFILPYFL